MRRTPDPIEHTIIADDRHILELGLRNQHAVERIPMVALESAGAFTRVAS